MSRLGKCKNCGKDFEWKDFMADEALRDKTTKGLCKGCRLRVWEEMNALRIKGQKIKN